MVQTACKTRVTWSGSYTCFGRKLYVSGVTTDLAEYLVSESARLPCSTFDGDEALMLVNLQLSTRGGRAAVYVRARGR